MQVHNTVFPYWRLPLLLETVNKNTHALTSACLFNLNFLYAGDLPKYQVLIEQVATRALVSHPQALHIIDALRLLPTGLDSRTISEGRR